MSVVNEKTASKLRRIFGDRVRVDRIERKMYSFDVGALASLIKPPCGYSRTKIIFFSISSKFSDNLQENFTILSNGVINSVALLRRVLA